MALKCLILGGSGFIGFNLTQYLLEKTDWDIRVLDKWDFWSHKRRLTDFPLHSSDRWQNQWDNLERYKIHRIIKGEYDIIINLASLSSVDKSIKYPNKVAKNNTNLMINILDAVTKIKPKIFLHLGTDEEFGDSYPNKKFREWDTQFPSNPYSASKACQSLLALSWWRTFNIPLVILNSVNVFGPYQQTDKLIPKCVKSFLNNRRMPIHVDENNKSTGHRKWLYVKDLCEAIYQLVIKYSGQTLQYPTAELPLKFNINTNTKLSPLEIAQKIEKILGIKGKYKYVSANEIRPGYDMAYDLNDDS